MLDSNLPGSQSTEGITRVTPGPREQCVAWHIEYDFTYIHNPNFVQDHGNPSAQDNYETDGPQSNWRFREIKTERFRVCISVNWRPGQEPQPPTTTIGAWGRLNQAIDAALDTYNNDADAADAKYKQTTRLLAQTIGSDVSAAGRDHIAAIEAANDKREAAYRSAFQTYMNATRTTIEVSGETNQALDVDAPELPTNLFRYQTPTSLPAGVTFNTRTGNFGGTPTTAGDTTATVQACTRHTPTASDPRRCVTYDVEFAITAWVPPIYKEWDTPPGQRNAW